MSPFPRLGAWFESAFTAGIVGVLAGAAMLLQSPRPAPFRGTGAPRVGRPNGPILDVPRAHGSLVIDGDTDDPGWSASPPPARTGAFRLAHGTPACPYSEARLVWQGAYLYLALYAADQDIRSGMGTSSRGSADGFRVTWTHDDTDYVLDVSPDGKTVASLRSPRDAAPRAWPSGTHVGFERDGTIDDPSDIDEEWLIEMAIPFAALGMRGETGESVGFTLQRCDATEGGVALACAGWGEEEDGKDSRGRLVLQ